MKCFQYLIKEPSFFFFFLEVIGVIRSFEQGYNRIITRKVIVQRMLEELQLWLDKEAIATLCV